MKTRNGALDRCFSLLAVSSIHVNQNQLELLLDSKEKRRKLIILQQSKGRTFDAEYLAMKILEMFKNYFPVCNESILKSIIELKPAHLYSYYGKYSSDARYVTLCGNFYYAYHAMCNYFGVTPRDDFIQCVEEMGATEEITSLRLNDLNDPSPNDLIPVVAVLRFNSYFQALILDGNISAELSDAVSFVFQQSRWLKRIVLHDCFLSKKKVHDMMASLAYNEYMPLQAVDFLQINLSSDGDAFRCFKDMLSNRRDIMQELQLKNCYLNSKAVRVLVQMLNGDVLRVLSFAGNNLKEDIPELCQMLSRCRYLEFFDLSGTLFPLKSIWTSLTPYIAETLVALKLDRCSFDYQKNDKYPLATLEAIESFFSVAIVLKTISFVDTLLCPHVLTAIMKGLARNQYAIGISLDLSRSFDDNCSNVLVCWLPKVIVIETLVVRNNNLAQEFFSLFRAVGQMANLRKLDVGGDNFRSLIANNKHDIITRILDELANFLKVGKNIHTVILSGCELRGNLSCMVEKLINSGNASVRSIDISGNMIGDVGAEKVAEALQLNETLQSLILDHNDIRYGGVMKLYNAFKENNTLTSLSAQTSLIEITGIQVEKFDYQIKQALSWLQKCLDRNQNLQKRGGSTDEMGAEISQHKEQKEHQKPTTGTNEIQHAAIIPQTFTTTQHTEAANKEQTRVAPEARKREQMEAEAIEKQRTEAEAKERQRTEAEINEQQRLKAAAQREQSEAESRGKRSPEASDIMGMVNLHWGGKNTTNSCPWDCFFVSMASHLASFPENIAHITQTPNKIAEAVQTFMACVISGTQTADDAKELIVTQLAESLLLNKDSRGVYNLYGNDYFPFIEHLDYIAAIRCFAQCSKNGTCPKPITDREFKGFSISANVENIEDAIMRQFSNRRRNVQCHQEFKIKPEVPDSFTTENDNNEPKYYCNGTLTKYGNAFFVEEHPFVIFISLNDMQAKDWRKLPEQILILGNNFYLGSCNVSGVGHFTCMVKIVEDWFYYDGLARPELFVSYDHNESMITEKLAGKKLTYAFYYRIVN